VRQEDIKMRKFVGPILVGLGAFLLVVAVLTAFFVPGMVKKTPLGVDSVTRLSGEADRLGAGMRPIYALSVTKTDDNASTDDVAVFTNYSCAVFDIGQDPQECADAEDENALSIGDDVFATDRVTALAVEFDGLPEGSVQHEGLVNKWPFDAEQKTYPYWDGTIGQAVDAVYDRTEEIDGLETYVYKATVEDAAIEVAEGVSGTYSDVKEIYIDPRTGSIIHQTEQQQRFLDDGTPALDLTLGFTEEQQSSNASDAKDNIKTLDLLTKTVPLVGGIVGVLLLVLGALLTMRSRRGGARAAS